MTPSDLKIRFDELCAGRAMGDLSWEEERELSALCAELKLTPQADCDLLVAAFDLDRFVQTQEQMPEHLIAKLHQWADESMVPMVPNVIQPQIPSWKKVLSNPVSGWAAAAAMLIFTLIMPREKPSALPASSDVSLRAQAKDLIERKFEGLGKFESASGSVIWSDHLQQGFMILSGIPANDSSHAQYQLWVVDPSRDPDSPVDGGVFDIPKTGGSVVIPIDAKLVLKNPQAFVITLEQPGGVVKSKQEVVVALAKG